MDEAGGRSVNNPVKNGEVESRTEVTRMEDDNGRGGFGGSIKQQTLTDPKPSGSSVDDRLKPSAEPAIQQIEDKQSNNKLSDVKVGSTGRDYVCEDGVNGQDHVQEDGNTSQDHVHEDGLMGQDHVKESGPTGVDHVREDDPMGNDHVQEDGHTGQHNVQEDGLTCQDHVKESGPTGQDHLREDGPTGQDHVREDGQTGRDHAHEDGPKGQEHPYGLANGKTEIHEEKKAVNSQKTIEKSKSFTAEIDTTAPFESVKAAVSMFGGIVDWKAHKIQVAERRKYVLQELRKANEQMPFLKKQSEEAEESKQQALKELDNARRVLEELKLNLERAETEEQQAKQDAALAKLRVEELEQGIEDESSVAAKTQLEVAQARHQASVYELKTVKTDLENFREDYIVLLSERDLAIKNAGEAEFNSKEIEKDVEGLTIRLMTMKEALESAHAAHLEAEEHRAGGTMDQEQEVLNWGEELKRSEEELEKVNHQIDEIGDLKSKLDTTSVLLQRLKVELATYMEENHKDIQSAVDLAKTELEELKNNIEKAIDEVNRIKQYANSLNSELENEKETLILARKTEELARGSVESLEADLKRTIKEVELIQIKEKEAQEKALQLPGQLEQAGEEMDRAKSRVQKAQQELQNAKEAADQAKESENNMISKLNAALKEIETARSSERLALDTISALHESESARNSRSEPEPGVTLSVEEYYELSRKVKEAEDEGNTRVTEAISQVDLAKEDESKAQNKLEQVNSDIASKKEQLSTAMQRAEKANEGKTEFEQELKTWKSENEQKTKANTNGIGSSREVKPRKKKKRSFFPRFFFFFSRKKGHSSKNNNT